MHDALPLVLDWRNAAAGLLFGVGRKPFRAIQVAQVVSHRAVAGHARRLAEHHLADVDRNVLVRVDVFGQRRHARIERRFIGVAPAVAVKLDVGHVPARPFEGPHRFQRRRPVARHAEIIGVDMHAVRQPQAVGGAGCFANDGSRRNVEARNDIVQPMHVARLPLLPYFHAAGIHELRAVAFGAREEPGHETVEPFEFAGRDGPHCVVVVAEQHEKRLIEARRIGKFLMRMPRG